MIRSILVACIAAYISVSYAAPVLAADTDPLDARMAKLEANVKAFEDFKANLDDEKVKALNVKKAVKEMRRGGFLITDLGSIQLTGHSGRSG